MCILVDFVKSLPLLSDLPVNWISVRILSKTQRSLFLNFQDNLSLHEVLCNSSSIKFIELDRISVGLKNIWFGSRRHGWQSARDWLQSWHHRLHLRPHSRYRLSRPLAADGDFHAKRRPLRLARRQNRNNPTCETKTVKPHESFLYTYVQYIPKRRMKVIPSVSQHKILMETWP